MNIVGFTLCTAFCLLSKILKLSLKHYRARNPIFHQDRKWGHSYFIHVLDKKRLLKLFDEWLHFKLQINQTALHTSYHKKGK